MGEADADPEEAPPVAPGAPGAAGASAAPADEAPTPDETQPIGESPDAVAPIGSPQAGVPPSKAGETASAGTEAADPWAAILEAGAALLQGLATTRSANRSAPGAAPFAIERDPTTGQASVRLPLPEPALLQKLAKALEPWLR
jgi:hypothetical protein